MQQHDIIDDFIWKCCPKGLPRYRRKMLERELEAHIYEKAEFLAESGMSDDERTLAQYLGLNEEEEDAWVSVGEDALRELLDKQKK